MQNNTGKDSIYDRQSTMLNIINILTDYISNELIKLGLLVFSYTTTRNVLNGVLDNTIKLRYDIGKDYYIIVNSNKDYTKLYIKLYSTFSNSKPCILYRKTYTNSIFSLKYVYKFIDKILYKVYSKDK